MPTLAWAWHPGKSVMAMRLLTTVRFDGDRDFAAHAASALRGGRRSLFLAIGQLGMASAGERLTTVLRQDGAVRSGRLAASLRGGAARPLQLPVGPHAARRLLQRDARGLRRARAAALDSLSHQAA